MTTAERHIVECWSTLKLGFEVLSARLVGGSPVDATELIKLNEALAAYMPKRQPYETNRLEVCFVNQTTAGLSTEAHARLEELADKLEKLPATCTPEDMHAALLQLELRDRKIEDLKARLAEATRPVAYSDPPVLMGEITPPPAQRQLPTPQHQPEEPTWNLDLIVRGNQHPALDMYKKDWPVY
jgi:hypothetical protein